MYQPMAANLQAETQKGPACSEVPRKGISAAWGWEAVLTACCSVAPKVLRSVHCQPSLAAGGMPFGSSQNVQV